MSGSKPVKAMRVLIITIIALFPAMSSANGLNGSWILPDKYGEPVRISFIEAETDVVAVLSISVKCARPISVVLTGRLTKRKSGFGMDLTSKPITQPNVCSSKFLLLISNGLWPKNGRLKILSGKIKSVIYCPDATDKVEFNDVSGVWLRKRKGK